MDRSNNKKLTKPVNTCTVIMETAELVKVSMEKQWAETVVRR